MSANLNSNKGSNNPKKKLDCKNLSYNQCKKEGMFKNIQSFLLSQILTKDSDCLTCHEISKITGITVQALTRPLKTLKDSGKLDATRVKHNRFTGRFNTLYCR